MTTALITRTDLSVGFTAEAETLKENALAKAALIGRAETAEQNAQAAEAQSALADLRRAVVKAHKDEKEPFLRAGQQLDAQKNEFLADILTEEARMSKVCGDFHQLQEAKRKAAELVLQLEREEIERKDREEQMRILREEQERLAAIRREEEKLAREKAERESAARKEADEAARKVREAANAEARKKAEKEAVALREKQALQDAKDREEAERRAIELKRQAELAAANTHDQLDAAQQRASDAQAAVAPAVAPVRVANQRVKPDLEITITDIYLLAKVHPGLVKIEARMSDIKAAIQGGAKIAGVTSREITVVQTTSRKQTAFVEV